MLVVRLPLSRSHGQNLRPLRDSHDLSDCRFNCDAPRCDAIACYDLSNAPCIKKIAAGKLYADGLSAIFSELSLHATVPP